MKHTTSSLLAGFVLLAGCTDFAPPLEREAQQDLLFPAAFAAAPPPDTGLAEGLLDLFEDDALRAVTIGALDANLDVRTAALQMEQVGFAAAIDGIALFPNASGNLGHSRSGGSVPVSGQAQASLDVSWEADLWGRLRDIRDAAALDAEGAAQQFRAVRASIAAQVIQGWFEYTRAAQSAQLEEQRLSGLKRSMGIVRRNYRAGIGTLDDLSAIERDVALANDQVLASRGARKQAARSLEILMGQYPDGLFEGSQRLPVLPPAPAVGIPAGVVAERPDLQAAWAQVQAADKRISVAQKDLLPKISLTGSFGSTSPDFSELLSGATIWSLAGNLTGPVFEAGRRKTEIKRSRNRADQAWLAYLQLALRAFGEVEKALDQEQRLRLREGELSRAASHASDTAELFGKRYQAGLVSILELLNAQNAVFDIRTQLLTVRAARLSNRVALGLALGKEA